MIGEWRGLWQTKGHDRSALLQGEGDSTCLFAELSVGSATVPIWAGWTWTYTTLIGFNVGRSVEAGGRGGGAPVPGSCSQTTHFIFIASAMWGKQHDGILFALAGGRPGTLGADRHCR